MPFVNGAYLIGPLIALLVIGAFALALRWTFDRDAAHGGDGEGAPADLPTGAGPGLPTGAGPGLPTNAGPGAGPNAGPGTGPGIGSDADDLGLLAAVALAPDAATAQSVRRRLAEAGIRSTVSTGLDGLTRVLVFADEIDRARRVVGGSADRSE
jgi:hypothetical protein